MTISHVVGGNYEACDERRTIGCVVVIVIFVMSLVSRAHGVGHYGTDHVMVVDHVEFVGWKCPQMHVLFSSSSCFEDGGGCAFGSDRFKNMIDDAVVLLCSCGVQVTVCIPS